jgi:predicted homoserine dehydrogenase-like protein
VVGAGFFGSGLVRRLAHVRGMAPSIVAGRTARRAADALRTAGVALDRLVLTDSVAEAEAALAADRCVATSDPLLPARAAGIDVVMEATGDILVGTEVALEAIAGRKHVVSANVDTQATVGTALRAHADHAGVVYSDVAGDEPGMLAELHAWCCGLGFTPIVAGNCKGVLKRYATPETQAAFAADRGLKPWLATAAADGTKLNLEMTAVANATGMPPAVRGMTGPTTTLERVVEDLGALGLLQGGPIVEFTLGMVNGVFMIVRADSDPGAARDLAYLKMGDGPHYVLYRPNVMIHFEAPLSGARAVLYGAPTITPRPEVCAETITLAKRDIPAGVTLDGLGGFDVYGLIERAAVTRSERLIPMGIAGYARLLRPVGRDQPISSDDVEITAENAVTRLRAEQDAAAVTTPG